MSEELKILNYITMSEYVNLPYVGMKLAEYLGEFKPKMCQEMKEEGTLLPFLEKRGWELADLHWNLSRQGLPEDAVMEIVREEIYAYEPEPEIYED